MIYYDEIWRDVVVLLGKFFFWINISFEFLECECVFVYILWNMLNLGYKNGDREIKF